MPFKTSIHYNNGYNALTAPLYSRVGESCAGGETETLELNKPNNLPREERHHGALPHLFIPAKEAITPKQMDSHLYRDVHDANQK